MSEEEEGEFRRRIQEDLKKLYNQEKKHRTDWAKDEMGYSILRASTDYLDQTKKERFEEIVKRENEEPILMEQYFQQRAAYTQEFQKKKGEMKKPTEKEEDEDSEEAIAKRNEEDKKLIEELGSGPALPLTLDAEYRRRATTRESIREFMKDLTTQMHTRMEATLYSSSRFKTDKENDPPLLSRSNAIQRKSLLPKFILCLVILLIVTLLYLFRDQNPHLNQFFDHVGGFLSTTRYKLLGPSIKDQGLDFPFFKKLIPKANQHKKYTLVIDPDILSRIAYDSELGLTFKTRPAFQWFLTHLAKDYELILFHDGNWVMYDNYYQQFDPTMQLIDYKVYSEGTFTKGDKRCKNYPVILTRRNPNFTIFLDTREQNYELVPENCLLLPPWAGNENDETLQDLALLLMEAANSGQPKRFITKVKEATKLGVPK